jgi:hypothetical protein
MMKKTSVRIVVGLVAAFLVAQLFRPTRTNPSSDPSLSITNYKGVPPEVLSKMESVCFDCHSNQTRWPWYSYVTPVNYFIASDVNSGRRHVNFSEWNNYSPGRLKSILDNIYDQVYNHDMPLPEYRWMHPDARLTNAEVKMICDWAGGEEDRLDQVSEMQSESNAQQQVTNDTTGTKK